MRTGRISASGDKQRPIYKISKDRCVPEPVEITVPNFQEVSVKLMTYEGETCVSVPAFKADPKPDYGATLTALFKYLPAFVGSAGLLEEASFRSNKIRLADRPSADFEEQYPDSYDYLFTPEVDGRK
jgi:hypothetical protein